MHVDNTAVMHCYNKLHSTVPFANTLLAESVSDGMNVTAVFVPTDYNCVDQFTRPLENPRAPPQTPIAVFSQIIVLKDGTRAAYHTFRLYTSYLRGCDDFRQISLPHHMEEINLGNTSRPHLNKF